MLLIVGVGTLSISGLGVLLGGLAYLSLDANLSINAVVFALLLASGANIPLEELPAWVGWIGQALPLTRSIAAARIVAGGGGLPEALPFLAGDAVVGLGYGVAGLLLLRWFEHQARRRGTLEAV
jgi:ABC-2 type transport system permease protein